ncbi:MAG: YbjQ family protein [Acidimicrobiaceae bacterium]|nr:YbjQ family protein [Acidimicrobiaceae bacterium]
MIVSTTSHIAGHRMTQTLGLVRGNTIRARHLGRDIKAIGRQIVGGEIAEYTKLLAEAREQALDRMVAEATELGADAIVGTRFATSMVVTGGAELLAFGTAVVIEPEAA